MASADTANADQNLAQQADIDALLRSETPLIDLRAPVEFARGSAPGAINLPILSNTERHQIGLCYRQEGAAVAERLGQQLVRGALQQARVQGWSEFLNRHPNAAIFCWRGGQRTRYAAQWLQEGGLQPVCVPGGYKAIRRRCLSVIDNDSHRLHWLVLGGQTGVGKTLLLNGLPYSVDLEGLAAHRGSAFGGLPRPQPTQVNFENQLATKVLQLRERSGLIVLEDESRTIGKVALPASWHQRLQGTAVVLLEADQDQRASHIAREYVQEPIAAGVHAGDLLRQYLHAVHRIRKRLGGVRTQEVSKALTESFKTLAKSDANQLEKNDQHLAWIRLLLNWYYDPMYDYQLTQKADRIVFRGNAGAVADWLAEQANQYPPGPTSG